MKHLFIFLLAISSQLGAQSINSSIYKAEELIMTENYHESADIYYELSKSNELSGFDLVNSLLCSLESEDTMKISYFINKLFKIGAPVEYFENELNKYKFFESDRWEHLKINKPEFNRNNKIILAIKEMIEVDQNPRKNAESYEEADFKIHLRLNSITKESGFPTEKDYGFDYFKSGYNSGSIFFVLILHQIKRNPYKWGEILPKLYWDKKISRKAFVFLSAHIKSCDDMQLACLKLPAENAILFDDEIYTCCCEDVERININRKKYELESIENQLKKSIFLMETNTIFKIGRSIPEFQKKSDKSIMIHNLRNMGLIKYKIN